MSDNSTTRPTTATTIRGRGFRDTRRMIVEALNDPARSRRSVISVIVQLFLLLLVLLLLAIARGYEGIISIPTRQELFGPKAAPVVVAQSFNPAPAAPTRVPAVQQAVLLAPVQIYPVSARFADHYEGCGGEPIFGKAISPEVSYNGRVAQWFERGRLEWWPELAGDQVQGGLVGVEYTAGQVFAKTPPFTSTPTARYFPQTGYGVANAFLNFWNTRGGMINFGYPISGERQEVLSDGKLHTVQYFQRARMEYWPEYAGTPYEVQLGRLGAALYLNQGRTPQR